MDSFLEWREENAKVLISIGGESFFDRLIINVPFGLTSLDGETGSETNHPDSILGKKQVFKSLNEVFIKHDIWRASFDHSKGSVNDLISNDIEGCHFGFTLFYSSLIISP